MEIDITQELKNLLAERDWEIAALRAKLAAAQAQIPEPNVPAVDERPIRLVRKPKDEAPPGA